MTTPLSVGTSYTCSLMYTVRCIYTQLHSQYRRLRCWNRFYHCN